MVRAKLQLNMFKKNRPFKIKQTNITTLENTERLKEKLEDRKHKKSKYSKQIQQV